MMVGLMGWFRKPKVSPQGYRVLEFLDLIDAKMALKDATEDLDKAIRSIKQCNHWIDEEMRVIGERDEAQENAKKQTTMEDNDRCGA